jgi:hypothetical protein
MTSCNMKIFSILYEFKISLIKTKILVQKMPLDHIDYKNAFAKDLAINKLFDK